MIERAAQSIGRLYLARWRAEHRIVDIALLPEHRGARLGTALLCDLLEEAAAAGKAVTIHVRNSILRSRSIAVSALSRPARRAPMT